MVWTSEIKEFIFKNYVGTGHKEMADMLKLHFDVDISKGQVKSFYGNHKLNSGLTGQFKKGNVPANKGVKGGYMKSNKTSFQKGNIPLNYKPVDSERITVDGYIEVKVADLNKWKMKHVIVWESANGVVPKGHVVIFADGNRQNINLDNLILVSRSQLLVMNRYGLIGGNADLTKTGVIIADIHLKIGEKRSR